MRARSFVTRSIDWALARTLGRYIEREIVRGYRVFGDRSRVRIDSEARVYGAHFNTSSGCITVERNAFFGPNVVVVTGTHDYRQLGLARNLTVPESGQDVVIREGAWIAASVTVLGPCEIGQHAVIAAGSIVNRDVPPYALVAGAPARVIGDVRDGHEGAPMGSPPSGPLKATSE